MPVPAVFIASTYDDLHEYRRQVAEACTLNLRFPVQMESWGPSGLRDVGKSLEYVEKSDIFLLILAHCYGTQPDGEKSFTELEFERALLLNKEIHVFAVDQGYDWTGPRDTDEAKIAALTRFRAQAGKAARLTLFTDPQDLYRKVTQLFLGSQPLMPPLAVDGRPYATPEDLALELSGASDWEFARRLFSDDDRLRLDLARWLRGQGSDARYHDRATELVHAAVSRAEKDERILAFIAHFAPQLRAAYEGKPAQASNLAADLATIGRGIVEPRGFVLTLTEPMLAALAVHACHPRHQQCSEAPGCQVLAGAWGQWQRGLGELARLVPVLGQVGVPDLRQIEAKVRQAALDPDVAKQAVSDAGQLGPHEVDWWHHLALDAGSAPPNVARALLRIALDHRAVEADIDLHWQREAAERVRLQEEQARAEQERRQQEAAEQERLARESVLAAREREEAERRREAEEQAAAQRRDRTKRIAEKWLHWLAPLSVILTAVPVAVAVRAASTHWEREPSPLVLSAAAVAAGATIISMAIGANVRLWRGRHVLNGLAAVALVALLGANAWLIFQHGWIYGAHPAWMIFMHLFWLALGGIAATTTIHHSDSAAWGMAFMAVGLLGAMPLALLVAGIVNGSAAGHAAWIWAGILLAVALTAVVLARFKRAMPLAVALVGAILLAEIPLVGQHHGLITAHWYWSLTAIVAMLFWVSGWFLAALDN